MITTGARSSVLNRFAQRFAFTSCFATLCVLVTGCPHNEYTVELQPKGAVIERTLTFYRADGSDSNGVPNYQEFPTNELAAITKTFPAGAVKQDGQLFVAKAEFAGALPADVGGFGTYTNFSSSLGEAGFYMERFRGNDDFAARTEKRFRAADQITDHVIGWAHQEFGRERGYKKLKKFLDEDFRRDLKNAGLYLWQAQAESLSNTNAFHDWIARYSQYLLERGYVQRSEALSVLSALQSDGSSSLLESLLRRLAAEKMGIPPSGPFPKSFAVFDDQKALEASWERYLSGTDLYHAQVKAWKQKRKADPKLEAPKPSDAMNDLFAELFESSFFGGEADHLTVRLFLPVAPDRANGKWTNGVVTWDSSLETNRALPTICYASWTRPNAEFQAKHFGRLILQSEALMEYCAWRSELSTAASSTWETFLSSLKPESNLKEQIEKFSSASTQNAKESSLERGSKLLLKALDRVAEQK